MSHAPSNLVRVTDMWISAPPDTGRLFRVRPGFIEGLRMMRDTSPSWFYGLGIYTILMASLAPLLTLSFGWLVGALPEAVSSGSWSSPAADDFRWALGAMITIFFLQQVLEPIAGSFKEGFRALVSAHRRERLMRATLAVPGIRHLEDAKYLDSLRLASSRDWPDPGSFSVGVYSVLNQRFTSIIQAFVVGFFLNWFIAIFLYLVWSVVGFYFRKGQAEGLAAGSAELRRSNYFRSLAFNGTAAKETRIFGLGSWLGEQFSNSWLGVMSHVWKARQTRMKQRIILLAAILFANVAGFGYLSWAAYNGELSLSHITIAAFAMLGISRIADLDENTMAISLGTACFPAIRELELRAKQDKELSMSGRLPADGLPEHEIVFENVTFAYPGTNKPIYENLNLTIHAGQSLGIVGANGAGKTTLIKLLARLYDPDSGRILVDGIDLRELNPRAWQRRVAAIFQDFVQYPYSVADNVGFGSIENRDDHDKLEQAAQLVGADDLIHGLPQGWETLLSRKYEDGMDISGGQWQRIALARALFAVEGGAGILVLDEPTANLDARAEVLLFDRFLEVTQGATSVLISHRFSTVRRADRIVVIDHGRVVEEGTHDELLKLEGSYARAFHLQAGRYKEDGASVADLDQLMEIDESQNADATDVEGAK